MPIGLVDEHRARWSRRRPGRADGAGSEAQLGVLGTAPVRARGTDAARRPTPRRTSHAADPEPVAAHRGRRRRHDARAPVARVRGSSRAQLRGDGGRAARAHAEAQRGRLEGTPRLVARSRGLCPRATGRRGRRRSARRVRADRGARAGSPTGLLPMFRTRRRGTPEACPWSSIGDLPHGRARDAAGGRLRGVGVRRGHRGRRRRAFLSGEPPPSAVRSGSDGAVAARRRRRVPVGAAAGRAATATARFAPRRAARPRLSRVCRPHGDRGVPRRRRRAPRRGRGRDPPP